MAEISKISWMCINKYNDADHPEVNEKIVRNLTTQIVKGLNYLMDTNIVIHLLKLNNVLLNFPDYAGAGTVSDDYLFDFDPDYDKLQIVIADFGLSKELDQSDYTDSMVGTPYAMAPEILTNEYYNNQVDIWSLGVITFELLSGELPFKGTTKDELIDNIKSARYSFRKDCKASNAAKDFVNWWLRSNPNNLISHEKLLLHPFMTGEVIKPMFAHTPLTKSDIICESTIGQHSRPTNKDTERALDNRLDSLVGKHNNRNRRKKPSKCYSFWQHRYFINFWIWDGQTTSNCLLLTRYANIVSGILGGRQLTPFDNPFDSFDSDSQESSSDIKLLVRIDTYWM